MAGLFGGGQRPQGMMRLGGPGPSASATIRPALPYGQDELDRAYPTPPFSGDIVDENVVRPRAPGAHGDRAPAYEHPLIQERVREQERRSRQAPRRAPR